jgi:hypothetical protein
MATRTAAPQLPPISRAYRAVIDDVSRPRRTVTARVNTSCVDRYRTVILPAGGDFARFYRTPAVLWEHGHDPTRGRLPVGTCRTLAYRKKEDDILSSTEFKTDDYSDQIFQGYVDGTLSAFSIDFQPDMSSSSRPTPQELKARPDWAGAECIYRRWEMTGLSCVAYPGNPEALATAVERGLWVPEEVKRSLPQRGGAMHVPTGLRTYTMDEIITTATAAALTSLVASGKLSVDQLRALATPTKPRKGPR